MLLYRDRHRIDSWNMWHFPWIIYWTGLCPPLMCPTVQKIPLWTFQSSITSYIMHFSNAFYDGSGYWNWWSSFRQRTSQSSNHGIRTTPGSAPPWRNGFLPRYTWREPAWADRSRDIRPTLPARQPDHSVWSFPTGNLTWTLHTNGLSSLPETAQIPPAMPRPQTFHERPEIAPWLAKNPFQPTMPMLQWDVRQNPITARLTTGAHVSTNLAHVLSSPITNIPVTFIEIAIPTPMVCIWNAIRVQKSSVIKVQDVLDAIYEWLQIPLTRAEMEHIENVNPDAVDAILHALQERAFTSPTLHGWEHRQGPRRIDCLGDVRGWMGLSYSPTGQGMQLVLDLQVIQRP